MPCESCADDACCGLAAIAAGDQGYRAFEDFRLSFAGGKMGQYGAQAVYLWWKLRDMLNV